MKKKMLRLPKYVRERLKLPKFRDMHPVEVRRDSDGTVETVLLDSHNAGGPRYVVCFRRDCRCVGEWWE